MRDYKIELEQRVEFIRNLVKTSGVNGIVFGSSGGKDSALVGILCKYACENTVGIMMPCGSKQNFGQDLDDANALTEQFGIEKRVIDLTPLKELAVKTFDEAMTLNENAITNIAPRLRMITVYAVAASEGRLVAGTGNRSEGYMGYFTKWGDGAHDFNPISDLTVTEIYEFLRFLNAPQSIIYKAPSAGLFEGQTDEKEMGISYAKIDDFLLNGTVTAEDKNIIDRYHNISMHKRELPITFK